MMLNLFSEIQEALTEAQALKEARLLLISSLNKGVIPRWEYFEKELPGPLGQEILIKVKKKFEELIFWPHLKTTLNEAGNEYFLHGPQNS